MKRQWDVRVRGGAFDGFEAIAIRKNPPAAVLVMWKCNALCDGHGTFDPHDPNIVLRTAESYRRVELDEENLTAAYEVGEPSPDGEIVEERELAGAGASLGDGWPVSP